MPNIACKICGAFAWEPCRSLQTGKPMKSLHKGGRAPRTDEERRAAIEAMPDEETEVVFDNGQSARINFRAHALAAEDDWDRFKTSPLGQALLDMSITPKE